MRDQQEIYKIAEKRGIISPQEDKTFCDIEIHTEDDGSLKLVANYDMAGELAHQITQKKETLWKHFCKNVCSRVIGQYTYMGNEVSLPDFEKKFEEAFAQETKEWDEL